MAITVNRKSGTSASSYVTRTVYTIMSEQQSRMKLNPLVQSTYCTVFYLLLSFKHVKRIKLDVCAVWQLSSRYFSWGNVKRKQILSHKEISHHCVIVKRFKQQHLGFDSYHAKLFLIFLDYYKIFEPGFK